MTALVDVLAHPDLSLVSSLGLADNGLCDEWWGRGLGSRLGSPACASLKDLDLRGNALSGAAAVELAPLLKDELAMLNKVCVGWGSGVHGGRWSDRKAAGCECTKGKLEGCIPVGSIVQQWEREADAGAAWSPAL